MTNNSLHKARDLKNDEFYTRYEDIEEEMLFYKDYFKDKTIYCNCDDPKKSNFWKYFHINFKKLHLNKLISTHYEMEDAQSYKQEYIGGQDEDITEGKITFLLQNGDFRSCECIECIEESDIIITNPPFSLFRDFINVLMDSNKDFIVLGNINALTYKEIFPYIQNNKIWLGYRNLNKDMYFHIPKEKQEWYVENKKEGSAYKIMNEEVMGRLASITWYTNIDHKKRHEFLKTNFTYRKNKELYKKFDGYDALNIDKVSQIPMDYKGIMGVPITFMDKYSPEQFKIVGIFKHGCDGPWDLARCFVEGKEKFTRIAIQKI